MMYVNCCKFVLGGELYEGIVESDGREEGEWDLGRKTGLGDIQASMPTLNKRGQLVKRAGDFYL